MALLEFLPSRETISEKTETPEISELKKKKKIDEEKLIIFNINCVIDTERITTTEQKLRSLNEMQLTTSTKSTTN